MKRNKKNVLLIFSLLLSVAFILNLVNTTIDIEATDVKETKTIKKGPSLDDPSLYNTEAAQDTPAYRPNLVSAVKFVAASNFELGGTAVDESGFVWTWGYNGEGRTGVGLTSGYLGGMKRIPFFVDNNIKIKSVKSGYRQSFAVSIDGELYAWGQNNNGEMGLGWAGSAANVVSTPTKVPVPLTSGEKIELVEPRDNAAGLQTTVYVKTNKDRVFAWGYGGGNLIPGYNALINSSPVELDDISQLGKDNGGIKDIQIGNTQVLLLTENGKVFSWGSNTYGSTGLGTNAGFQTTPKEITTLSNKKIKQISAGYNHSMALSEDNIVYNWGAVYGTTSTAASVINKPTEVTYDSSSATYIPIPQQVVASAYNSLLIDQHGRIWEMGGNLYYTFMQDGPLYGSRPTASKYDWKNPLSGKLDTYLNVMTQLPKTMGDGDTQATQAVPKAPVFSNVPPTSTRLNFTLYGYENAGVWSDVDDQASKKHPTIYDKKYFKTTGDLKDIPVGSGIANQGASHKYVYPIDKDGNRLVYVVRKEKDSNNISGNFYIAEDSYQGGWFVNQRTTYELKAGITEETSFPEVKDDEKDWIELAIDNPPNDFTGTQGKEVPYIVDIAPYESSMTLIDSAGNIYKQSYNGSGNIAWGWDYMPQYDSSSNGNPSVNGLYDSYAYEIMFMRGAPRVSPTTVNIKGPINKIYKSDANQNLNSEVKVTLGTSTVSTQLNITINPELKEAKYVILPYDTADSNVSLIEPSGADFDNAYNNADLLGYEAGDLIDLNGWTKDDLINTSPDKVKQLSDGSNIIVKDNSVLWVKTRTVGYNANIESVSRQEYTNYYKDTKVYHEGIDINDNKQKVYTYNDDYVKKTSKLQPNEDEIKYGLPLDAKGNIIKNPVFGYDEVSLRAYEQTDPEFNSKDLIYYTFVAGQDKSLNLTLNDIKYLENTKDNSRFIHPFKYEKDMKYWVEVTYKGRFVGQTQDISNFTMDNLESNENIVDNKELLKKSIEGKIQSYTRTAASVENSQFVYFIINENDKNKPDSVNKFTFTTISDLDVNQMSIVLFYNQSEIYVRQVVLNESTQIPAPNQGFMELDNTGGTKGSYKYNFIVNSGTNEKDVKFKKAQLTLKDDNTSFIVNPIIPQMYNLYGYKISKTLEEHDSSSIVLKPEKIEIDFSANNKYYLTVYIDPRSSNNNDITSFNWSYKLNNFGNIEK